MRELKKAFAVYPPVLQFDTRKELDEMTEEMVLEYQEKELVVEVYN